MRIMGQPFRKCVLPCNVTLLPSDGARWVDPSDDQDSQYHYEGNPNRNDQPKPGRSDGRGVDGPDSQGPMPPGGFGPDSGD